MAEYSFLWLTICEWSQQSLDSSSTVWVSCFDGGRDKHTVCVQILGMAIAAGDGCVEFVGGSDQSNFDAQRGELRSCS